jgi:hypothetical protein
MKENGSIKSHLSAYFYGFAQKSSSLPVKTVKYP